MCIYKIPTYIHISIFIYKAQMDHMFSLLRERNKYSKGFYAQFHFLI